MRDLGGLGGAAGPEWAVNWTATGYVSPALPWLAILAMLALKPNRGWSAWWIWAPVAVLAAGWKCLEPLFQDPSSGLNLNAVSLLFDVPVALALGLAALWLLASYLGRRRSLTFLGSLLVLGGFSAFSFAATAGWEVGQEPLLSLLDPRHCSDTALAGEVALPVFVPLALLPFVLASGLALAGIVCRGRYRPWSLWLWLILSLSAAWLAASLLLHVVCQAAAPTNTPLFLPWIIFPIATPFIVLILYATLLPFQILSAASPLFRERLKALLRVDREPNR